jgi:hypothetical protein
MNSNKKFRYLIQRYFANLNIGKTNLGFLVVKDCLLLIIVLIKFLLFLIIFTSVRLLIVFPFYVGAAFCKYFIYYPFYYGVLKLLRCLRYCFTKMFVAKKLIFFAPFAYVFFFVFPKNKDLKFKEIFWYNNINRTNSLEKDFLKYNASFSTFRHLKRFKPKKFLISEKAFFRSVNSHRVGVHNTTPHFISYGGRRDIYRANSFVKDVFSYYPNKHVGNSYFFDWFIKKNNTNFINTSSELAFQSNYGNPFNFATKWYNNSSLPSRFKNLDSYIDSNDGDYSDHAYSSGRFMARRRGYKVMSPDVSAGFLNLKPVWDGREDFEFWRNNYKNVSYYQEGKMQEYRKLLHLLAPKRLFHPKLYRTVGALFDKWSISRRELLYSQHGFSGERSLHSTYNFKFLEKIKKRVDAAAALRRSPAVNASTEDTMQPPNIIGVAPRFWRANLNDWGRVLGFDWVTQKLGNYYNKRQPYLDRSAIWLNYNRNYNLYAKSFFETIQELRRLEIEEFIVARATYMILTTILSPELNRKRFLWTHIFFAKYCLPKFIVPSRFFNNENFQIANFFDENFSNSYQTFYKKENLNSDLSYELNKRPYIYEQPFIVNWNNFNQFQNYSNINSKLQIPYENVVRWKPRSNPFFRYTLFGRDSVFDASVNLSNNTLYEKYTIPTVYARATNDNAGGFRNFFHESTLKGAKKSREHLHLYFFKLDDVDNFVSEVGSSLLKNSFLANAFNFANYKDPANKLRLKILQSKKRHSDFSQSFLGREAVFGYQPGRISKEYMFFDINSFGKSGADFFESREVESLLERDAPQDSYEWMMDGIFRDGLFFLTKSAWGDLTNLIKNINFYNSSFRLKTKILKRKIRGDVDEDEKTHEVEKDYDPEVVKNWIRVYGKPSEQLEKKISLKEKAQNVEGRMSESMWDSWAVGREISPFLKEVPPLRLKDKLSKLEKEVFKGDFNQSFMENMVLLGRKLHFRRKKIRLKMGRALHKTLKPVFQPKRVTNHTPNWTLESGLDHMYLVWKNSKFSPIIYSPVRKRMTTADYWVLRRAFYKGFLSTSDVYRYLKTSRFLKKLRDVENKILNFIFNVMPSDFILVELKYLLLHFFLSFSFLDSFLIELSNFFSTDLMFLKNFFIRLLLCFSDQWLWFLFAYVKVSSSVCVNIFFDDIAGTFMFYSKSLDLYNTEAYVPIRKRGYRKAHKRYFRKQLIGRNRRLFQYKYSLDQLNISGQPVDNFLTKRAFLFRRKFSLQNSYFLPFNLTNGFIKKIKTPFLTSLEKPLVSWFREKEDLGRIPVTFEPFRMFRKDRITNLNREQRDVFIQETKENARDRGWKNKKIILKVKGLRRTIDFKEIYSKEKGRAEESTFIEVEKSLYHKYSRRSSYKKNKLFRRLKRRRFLQHFKPYEHLKIVRVAKMHSYSWRRLVIYHFSGRSKRRRKYFVPRNRFYLFSKYRRKKFVRSRIHSLRLFPSRLQYSFLGLMRYNNDFCASINFKNPLYLVDSKITTNLFSRPDVNSSAEINKRFFKFYTNSLRKRNFPLKFKYFYLFQYTRFLKSASFRGGEYALESQREFIFNKYRHRSKSLRLKNNTNLFGANTVIQREGSARLIRRFDFDGDKFILPNFNEDSKSARKKPRYVKLSSHIARNRRKRFRFIKNFKRYKPRRRFRSYKLLKIKQQLQLFIPFSIIYPLKQVFLLPFFLAKNYFFTSILLYIIISFLIVLLLSFRVAYNDLKYQISNQYLWSAQHSFTKLNFKSHLIRFKLVFIYSVYSMLDFRVDTKHILNFISNKINQYLLTFRINLISIQLDLLANLKVSLNFKFWLFNFIDNFFGFLKRVLKKIIQFTIFFMVLTLVLAVIKNYLMLSGRYITHLPSMLLVVLFFFLLIWFLSICSTKFIDNFLTSPYQAEQFLQENSGSYELDVEDEEIYHLEDNDIEEEQESFDEFPFYYHEDALFNNEYGTVQSDKIAAKKEDVDTYYMTHIHDTYTLQHLQFFSESLNQDIVAEFEEEESLKILLFTSQLFSPRKRSRKKFLHKYDKDWWMDDDEFSESEAHNAHFLYYYFGRSAFAEAYSSHLIDTVSDFRTVEEDMEEEDEWDIVNIEYFDEESEDDSDLFDYVEFSEEHAVARLYHDRFFENITLFNPSDTTFQPKEFFRFFADQEFGDAYVIHDMGWVNELFFDRFLLDINKDDVFMFHDQEIISKISAYGFDQLDGNSLDFSSFRTLSFSLLKELQPSSVFSHTYFTSDLMGLIRNDSVFGDGAVQDFDNFNILNASWRVQFLFSNSALTVNFNPYKFNIKDKLKIKSIPVLGYEIFNNKYKRKFFKNPEYYVRLLSLKNYPELTYEEAERLWAYLGCTKKEWNSVDNYLTDKMIVPYDNYDTPFAICALVLGIYYNKINMLNKNPRDRFNTYIDNEVFHTLYPKLKKFDTKRHNRNMPFYKENAYEYNPMIFFFDTVRLFVNFLNDNLFYKGQVVINGHFLSPQKIELIHSIFKKLCFSFFLYTGFLVDLSAFYSLLNFNLFFSAENNSFLIFWYFYFNLASLINYIFYVFSLFFNYMVMSFFFSLSSFYLAQTFFFLIILFVVKLLYVILYLII